MKKNISYSGIVLDNESHHILMNRFINQIPDGWDHIGHHSTICLGELIPEFKPFLGDTVELTVTSVGKSHMAMAVTVTGGYSIKSLPHITLAVNRLAGGKPYMSNNITEWEPCEKFTVSGTVQEISSII